MKVYVVEDYYYDHLECVGGSMMLGVYSTMASAQAAVQQFVDESMSEYTESKRLVRDHDNNPCVESMMDNALLDSDTYVISEWHLQ